MSSISHLNLNLRALCKEGSLKEALHILLTTQNPSVDSSTYLQLLQTCIDKNALSEGKQIHSHINGRGLIFATHNLLQNKVISMYDKCGSLVDTRKAFDHMTEPDVFSWNVIIAAYRSQGFPQEALILFRQMQLKGVQPNQFTFTGILPVFAKMGAMEHGMEIHERIIESGFLTDVVVGNSLIDMYAKCGNTWKARELFDKIPRRSVVSWNAMITGYAQNGAVEKAFMLFQEMPERSLVSWNAMIVGYAQKGVLVEALRLFKKMPQPNVISCTAIIAGYAQNGFFQNALDFFNQMELVGVKPNSATFASIIPACAKIRASEQGMEIHRRIMESGFLLDVRVANALIDMYTKCGSISKARELFDKMPQRDAISWNAIIAGYSQNGLAEKSLEIFKEMQWSCVEQNSATFASMLPACANLGVLELGMEIHQKILECGLLSDVVLLTSLVDMYAKCGSIQKARELFDKMFQRDVVSWNAIIAGYAQNGLVEKALKIFQQMQLEDVKPNSTTFASILPAFAKLGALEQGLEIHQKIIESGFSSDVVVVNAQIHMYAKCGRIHKARELFDKIHNPNVISWTAMIAGYAMHGFSKDALEVFELMKHSGTNPNHISFVCILFACSHAGLVDDGCKYFNGMHDLYCIMPSMDHYVCMVDLLGRAGYLQDALNFIIKMPIKPDVVVWICLLGACRSHKNIGLGEFVATFLFELDPKDAAHYVLLSNIYAEVGRWDDIQK
ncbi:hypothetical protein KI387_025515, partial [Taxus chinensis]